jgi:hypothetical protein
MVPYHESVMIRKRVVAKRAATGFLAEIRFSNTGIAEKGGNLRNMQEKRPLKGFKEYFALVDKVINKTTI